MDMTTLICPRRGDVNKSVCMSKTHRENKKKKKKVPG